VNSQSGKGGIAYLIQEIFGLDLPRKLQVAFYQVIQEIADRTGKEITTKDIEEAFRSTFFIGDGHEGKYSLLDYSISDSSGNPSHSFEENVFARRRDPTQKVKYFIGTIRVKGEQQTLEVSGSGNGPISSALDAINSVSGLQLELREYSEHTLSPSQNATAASYIELVEKETGFSRWGVGINSDTATSAVEAILSSVNGHVDATRIKEN
jgi:2-isopropylmalate synthase